MADLLNCFLSDFSVAIYSQSPINVQSMSFTHIYSCLGANPHTVTGIALSVLSFRRNDVPQEAGASTHTVPKLEFGNELKS